MKVLVHIAKQSRSKGPYLRTSRLASLRSRLSGPTAMLGLRIPPVRRWVRSLTDRKRRREATNGRKRITHRNVSLPNVADNRPRKLTVFNMAVYAQVPFPLYTLHVTYLFNVHFPSTIRAAFSNERMKIPPDDRSKLSSTLNTR